MSISKNTSLFNPVCRIMIIPVDETYSVDNDPDRFHRKVNPKNGKSWTEVYFTPGTAELSHKQKDAAAGNLFEHTLAFNTPGADETDNEELDPFIGRPLLVRIGLSNGSRLMGSMEIPAKLSLSDQVNSKATGTRMEFTCSAPVLLPWLTL